MIQKFCDSLLRTSFVFTHNAQLFRMNHMVGHTMAKKLVKRSGKKCKRDSHKRLLLTRHSPGQAKSILNQWQYQTWQPKESEKRRTNKKNANAEIYRERDAESERINTITNRYKSMQCVPKKSRDPIIASIEVYLNCICYYTTNRINAIIFEKIQR